MASNCECYLLSRTRRISLMQAWSLSSLADYITNESCGRACRKSRSGGSASLRLSNMLHHRSGPTANVCSNGNDADIAEGCIMLCSLPRCKGSRLYTHSRCIGASSCCAQAVRSATLRSFLCPLSVRLSAHVTNRYAATRGWFSSALFSLAKDTASSVLYYC